VSEKIRPRALSEEDHKILHIISTIVEGIGRQFGKFCEVVLFSLEDFENAIVAIKNGQVTGRSVGGPMTNCALSAFKKADMTRDDVSEPFYNKRKDGKTLKSTTTIIRNFQGKVIGFLCINFDISAPFAEVIESLLDHISGAKEFSEQFPATAKDLVDTSFNEVMEEIHRRTGISPTQKNKLVVEALYKRGVFHVKNAIDIVADKLGVSRYTIYNYIREVKTALGETEIEKLYV